jgi:hypothetical protein
MNEVLEKTLQVPFSEVSIESVLLDADLFVKYRSPEKALPFCANRSNAARARLRCARRCVTFAFRRKI